MVYTAVLPDVSPPVDPGTLVFLLYGRTRDDSPDFARIDHCTGARTRSAATLRALPVACHPRRRAHFLLGHDPGRPAYGRALARHADERSAGDFRQSEAAARIGGLVARS